MPVQRPEIRKRLLKVPQIFKLVRFLFAPDPDCWYYADIKGPAGDELAGDRVDHIAPPAAQRSRLGLLVLHAERFVVGFFASLVPDWQPPHQDIAAR